MQLNWGLLGNAPDPGQSFTQGMQQGQARRKQQDVDNALRTLSGNPDDPNAANALLAADPRLGMQYRQQQQEQRRLDQKSKQEGVEQYREAILAGGKLLREIKPQDEAGWQRFRAVAAQMRLPVEHIPAEYDPQYVQGLIQTADAMEPKKDDATTTLEREYQFILRTRGPEAADSFMKGKENPLQWVRTEDETGVHLTPVPRGGGMGGGQDMPVISSPEEARRLPPGTTFKTPDGRTMRVPGGASPGGSPTFP